MKQYKYTMDIEYVDKVNNKNIPIMVESLQTLIIDRDYEKKNMPTMFATFNLDKNLVDNILINASKNLFNITLYKFVANDNTEVKNKEVYFREQFTYIISGDINYNKDIDYLTADGDTEPRKDIYKTISIGLMKKQSIDDNKKSFNTTVLDTTMINVVNMVVKHMNILIEPFTYNDTIKQLIVPPIESVSKTLKFLNNTSVFYDTPYRFFMDYDTNYLIGSGGNPVIKKTDLYPTVKIELHKTNDQAGNVIGMSEDPTNKYYKIDVNVLDSYYSIDKLTEKKFNNITAILDSSKEKAESGIDNLTKSIDRANQYVEDINAVIKKNMDNIIGVSNSLNESKRSVTLTQKNIANNKVIFNNIMDRLDVAIVGVLNDLTVQTDLYNYRVDVNTNIDALLTLQETNNSVASSINSSMNSVTDISSYVNGVTAINITDNTNNMLNTVKNSSKHNSEATNKINNQLQPLSPKSQQIVTIIQSIISRLQSSAEASVLPDVQKEIPNLQSVSSAFSSISNDISSYVNDAKDANNMVKRVISNISPSVSNISNINADMKGLYTKVDSYIDLRRSNGIKNILSNFTGDITKSISGLGMEAIGQIKDNLDNVKDLSTIGQLGIPKIDAKLNIGGSLEDDVAKNKIVRINNDNPNMVKNMKADLETSSTLLSINKNDLDTSALTINKEYIIKNYDVHSDKDGRFLLARKREIYMREDTSFVMNTILEFKKLKDS